MDERPAKNPPQLIENSSPRPGPREWVIRVVLVALGVLTATPVQSLFDPAQLESYGVVDPDPIVLSLLQHRGVLQLLLGAALVWAAFRPGVRVPVAIGTIVSKGASLALTLSRPRDVAETSSVPLIFDAICIVVLMALLLDTALRARRIEPPEPAGA